MDVLQEDLARAREANPLFKGSVLVLERTENSDLVPVAKECTREFFSRVFGSGGPLWKVYAETHTGLPPHGAEYLSFLAGRMYFCRNAAQRFMLAHGRERALSLDAGKIVERPAASLANAVYFAASPFEAAKGALNIALLPAYFDAKMREFGAFQADVKAFDEANRETASGPEVAEQSLALAVRAMEYSFAFGLALQFNARAAESPLWNECDAQELFNLIAAAKTGEAIKRYGFHSPACYDITQPRLAENPGSARFLAQPAPKAAYARLRENAKFACSRCLAVERAAYLSAGRETGLGSLAFHLSTVELSTARAEPGNAKLLAEERTRAFDGAAALSLPDAFVFSAGKWQSVGGKAGAIRGKSVGGRGSARGAVAHVDGEKDYGKDVAGRIVVSRTLSPTLTILMDKAAAIVSESGSALSHTAIIARERGVPCIVQARGAAGLPEGTTVTVDAKTGDVVPQ